MSIPLHVTRLLLWEFRQFARFQSFRYRNDPTSGYPIKQAGQMIEKLSDHLELGLAKLVDCDLIGVPCMR